MLSVGFQQMIAEVDEDGGGTIDFGEFLTMISKRMEGQDPEVRVP